MEHGFFHPDNGYWQTLTYPDDKYRNKYPEGYIEVPLKPSANSEWVGDKWEEIVPPEYDPLTHTLKKNISKVGDKFEYTYDIIELPFETASKNVRVKRNGLLFDSDWLIPFHMERGEVIPTALIDYRQSLRDISNQDGFPYNVIWPTKP